MKRSGYEEMRVRKGRTIGGYDVMKHVIGTKNGVMIRSYPTDVGRFWPGGGGQGAPSVSVKNPITRATYRSRSAK